MLPLDELVEISLLNAENAAEFKLCLVQAPELIGVWSPEAAGVDHITDFASHSFSGNSNDS